MTATRPATAISTRLLYFKGYQSIQTHRMAHRLWHLGRKDFAYYLQSRSSMIASIDIHPARTHRQGHHGGPWP